jgi:hypothetical protein
MGHQRSQANHVTSTHLTKLQAPAAVAQWVEGWRPCEDAHHIGNDEQDPSTYPRLGRQSHLQERQHKHKCTLSGVTRIGIPIKHTQRDKLLRTQVNFNILYFISSFQLFCLWVLLHCNSVHGYSLVCTQTVWACGCMHCCLMLKWRHDKSTILFCRCSL